MISALVLIALAYAEPPPDNAVNPFREADESALFRFDEQLVTVASRYAQTARNAPSIVTVVTADDIRERGHRNLSDVLRGLPGLYVWRSQEGRDLLGVRGVISSDNNKVLLLIDGQPWYDGVYTHAWIDDYLPLSQVKQVEVIKGPGSAIYGTNAFTGVINIVTWSAEDLNGARIRSTIGAPGRSEHTAAAGGVATIGETEVSTSVWLRVFGQQGQGLDIVPRGRADFNGFEPRRGVATGGRLSIGDLTLQLQHIDYSHAYLVSEVDDPFDALGKDLDSFGLHYHNTGLDARYRIRLGENVTLSPYAYSQRHDNPSAYFFLTGTQVTVDPDTGGISAENTWVSVEPEKDTRRWGVGVDAEGRPGLDHRFVAGAGVENTKVRSLVDQAFINNTHIPFVLNGFAALDDCGQASGFRGVVEPCRTPALTNLFSYAQYSWRAAPAMELTAGARIDKRIPRNEGEAGDDLVFVPSVSPRAGVLLVPTDTLTAKLLYGRAFRAPNVRELLVRVDPDEDGNFPFSSGNLDLRPESIHTVEGEVTVELGILEARVDGSWSTLVNEIDRVTQNIYCNLPHNLDVTAAEAEIAVNTGPITARAAYALTLASYREARRTTDTCPEVDWDANPIGGRRQFEFPPHMVKANVRVAFTDHLSATLEGEVYSQRPRADWSNGVAVPNGDPFALLHLGILSSKLGKAQNVAVGLAARNLTDARFSTPIYRDQAGVTQGDALRNPVPLAGEGRTVLGTIELTL